MTVKRPCFHLTRQDIKVLQGSGSWTVNDLTDQQLQEAHIDKEIRPTFVGVLSSGDLGAVKKLHGKDAVGGFDVLALETRPRNDEPEGNAYHYIYGAPDANDRAPVWGPFKADSDVVTGKHWFDAKQLEAMIRALL